MNKERIDKGYLYMMIQKIENMNHKEFATLSINEKMKRYEDEIRKRGGYQDLLKEDIDNYIFQQCSAIDSCNIFENKHKPWVDSSNIEFELFERYKRYLVQYKDRPLEVVRELDESTFKILDLCGNPMSNSNFDVRGLVIGDIQSGKTANYTGLINRALDAGYMFIIVLAGTTNDLRAQTQKRLDKEVLGCETKENSQRGDAIGVGLLDLNDGHPLKLACNCLTNSNEDGDMGEFKSTIEIGREIPVIAIIKKNTSALDHLTNFIETNSAVKNSLEKKINCPVMLIDDEADLASINTNPSEKIEYATSINRKIRKILNLCKKVSYVGYTATPFANVFIPAYNVENTSDQDIFPRDFIVSLPRDDNYDGVRQFFDLGEYNEKEPKSDLYLKITDEEIKSTYSIYSKTKKSTVDTIPTHIPSSLTLALKLFLIASGVKVSRNINGHSSMLIHMDSHINYNSELKLLVQDEFESIISSFRFYEESKNDFKILWDKYFKEISNNRLGISFNDSWEKVEKGINICISWFDENRNNTVKLLNGKSSDVIDYDTLDHGLHIIVGGNKLSRGLTLDGLIISYYYRNTRAYDTLLQMGRWFGYKDGWLDLCRVFATTKVFNDFLSTSIALESFRDDVKEMNDLHYTPLQFGQKVRTSPKLLPTAVSKLRHATKANLSFSGTLQQTLNYDPKVNEYNRKVTSVFLNELSQKHEFENNDNSIVFRNVSVDDLLKYLKEYRECNDSGTNLRISVALWVKYIEKLRKYGELITWTVVLSSLTKSLYNNKDYDLIGPFKIVKSSRSKNANSDDDDLFHVRVLTNPADFNNFFKNDDPLKKMAKSYNPKTKFDESIETRIRESFNFKNGLITIYDFDYREHVENGVGNIYDNGSGIIGLGLWFPFSKDEENANVEYYFNDVYIRKQKEDLEAEVADNEE